MSSIQPSPGAWHSLSSNEKATIADRAIHTEVFLSAEWIEGHTLSELGSLLWNILVKDILTFHTEIRVCLFKQNSSTMS